MKNELNNAVCWLSTKGLVVKGQIFGFFGSSITYLAHLDWAFIITCIIGLGSLTCKVIELYFEYEKRKNRKKLHDKQQ